MSRHLSSLRFFQLGTIGNTVSETYEDDRNLKSSNLMCNNSPPQTGHPVNEPPRAARGSSMDAKNGGTLKHKKRT
jgi:hypothetical protein